jgi:aspartate aminotransferase
MAAVSRPATSRLIDEANTQIAPMIRFFTDVMPSIRERFGDQVCDFAAGNPQEGTLDGYVDALQRWTEPRLPDWYAYKTSEPEAQAVVANDLRDYLGIPFEPDDVALTNAAIAALAVTLRTICDPGDEVVIISPPHFLYPPLIIGAGATPVRVKVNRATFDLDLDALATAITERTRAVIVNTPHNPTGKIFPPATLERLAAMLTEASERHQPIYLLSDEAYNRILFDDRPFTSPAAFYPRTFLIYSYGKVLLAPAQRIGYVAMSPRMPERVELRSSLTVAQLITGYAFPNALLQYALVEIDPLRVDVKQMQARRDRLVEALRAMGYELHSPEATFYLIPRSPVPDDEAFCTMLAEEGISAMPGSFLDLPGYFRLSLTATDDMVERSLAGFERAIARAHAGG